ncbi:MAG: hypothetical protein LJE61_06620 [Thiocapsa sp.]|jgi:hypothetical protein|nr:hypothetical protein [Thiocapsa sp.]MCG6897667.1 hypothetical protein [Thiocapsa sp.]MCG6984858.1 hypothetical protein [Thiocapsa sp.]
MSDAPFELVDARDGFFDSNWFQHCRETQTPFVVVRNGETSADVLWDFVTLPPQLDAELKRDLASLERDARAIFDRYAVAESFLRVKATLIGFDRLPVDAAKSAAADLYRLITDYLPVAETVTRTPNQTDPDLSTGPGSTGGAELPKSHRLWVETISTSTAA